MPLLAALLAAWLAPVQGEATRGFSVARDGFAPGQHRGVDFAARRGEHVRSACSGRVTFAGRLPQGAGVTVRCGGRLVSYLPVTPLARVGQTVGHGAVIARARGALHLGVREGGRYVDPLRLLTAPAPMSGPPLAPVPIRPQRPRALPPAAAGSAERTAPALAWAGALTAALAAAGAGSIGRRRRLRVRRVERQPVGARRGGSG